MLHLFYKIKNTQNICNEVFKNTQCKLKYNIYYNKNIINCTKNYLNVNIINMFVN